MLRISKLNLWRSFCLFLSIKNEWSDSSMWTYECTAVTLNTACWIPLRNHNGCSSLLVCWSTCLKLTICNILKCRYWKAVTIHLSDRIKKFVNHLNCSRTSCSFNWLLIINCCCPVCWYFYLMYCINTCIDSLIVHLNYCITLLAVWLLSSCLHIFNSFINRHYVSKLEECWL